MKHANNAKDTSLISNQKKLGKTRKKREGGMKS